MNLSDRFWSKVHKADGCWVWTANRSQGGTGYGQFWDDGRLRQSHRLAWEEANGPIPEDGHILHTCDNKACVNPDHLFLGGRSANGKDMRDKGRLYNAKLDWSDVVNIRRMAAAGSTSPQLAKKFCVSDAHIRKVVGGREWK